jgi:uncharacterized protein (UPF0261 family)
MVKTIALVGTFDSKDEDYQFVRALIIKKGHHVLTINTGILGTTALFPVDIEAKEIAKKGGTSLSILQEAKDRGSSIPVMCAGAKLIVGELYEQEKIHGIFGMGGSGGTAMVTAAMQSLPIGFPKLCISTLAVNDTTGWVGSKDIMMMPSVVDVAGVNSISQKIYTQAVGAICGMVEQEIISQSQLKPIVAASMYGNTTTCVDRCRHLLSQKGYEVIVFHATGTGGKSMEDLVEQGLIDGVLDITTTEWADEICGGILSAGSSRLDAPGLSKIPHLVVPGCIDMCNFGNRKTIPKKYDDRLFYEWNPSVTLMRTSIEENFEMGKIFAEKANKSPAPVAFLIPLKGFSMLDSLNEDNEAQLFWDPEANQAFIKGLESKLRSDIPIVKTDHNINDEEFSQEASQMFLNMMNQN